MAFLCGWKARYCFEKPGSSPFLVSRSRTPPSSSPTATRVFAAHIRIRGTKQSGKLTVAACSTKGVREFGRRRHIVRDESIFWPCKKAGRFISPIFRYPILPKRTIFQAAGPTDEPSNVGPPFPVIVTLPGEYFLWTFGQEFFYVCLFILYNFQRLISYAFEGRGTIWGRDY